MKIITYNQGIKVVDTLLSQLETNNAVVLKDEIEYNVLHDSLITYRAELENEMERQRLIAEFNSFSKDDKKQSKL